MTTTTTTTDSPHSEAHYDALRAAMAMHIETATKQPLVLAAIDAKRLFIDNLPDAFRQHYNCSACKKFLESHGGLATVQDDGTLASALFPAGEYGELTASVNAIRTALQGAGVRKAPPQDPLAGRPVTRDLKRGKNWSHLHASGLIIKVRPSDARERLVMLQRGLGDFPAATLAEGHRLLTGGNLHQAERHAEMCGWLLALAQDQERRINKQTARNLLWRAAITAPVGYANFRGGALGALLEEVKAGKSFDAIKRRFETVMDPLKYQRQQSVSENQLAVAERRIAELGVAPSLRRRMATLADLQPFWTPPATQQPPITGSAGQVFGHVKPTGGQANVQPRIQMPSVSITWAKFARDVLPGAKDIKVVAPYHGGYYQFTTAADKTAPIIHQWPNHEAFYTYNGGSPASRFGIQPGPSGILPVVALVRSPHEWTDSPMSNHRKTVFFIIEGCGDTNKSQGCGIFPSNLKSDLHAVRAAIEAFSCQTPFEPHEGQAAGGLCFDEGNSISVYVDGQRYQIDRWE